MSPNSTRSTKQQLHLWLRNVVNSGNCPGVEWVDKPKAIFKIPWLNKKNQDWTMDQASIFLDYARHKGRYESDQPINYPKLKQNLKSAIDKKYRFIKRLHTSKTHRFYMFVEQTLTLSRDDQERQDLVAGASSQSGTCSTMMEATSEDMVHGDMNTARIFNEIDFDSFSDFECLPATDVAAILDNVTDMLCDNIPSTQQNNTSLHCHQSTTVNDSGSYIIKEAERANANFQNLNKTRMDESDVNKQNVTDNSHVFYIQSQEAPRKVETSFSGKVSIAEAVQNMNMQTSSFSLVNARAQSSNDSSCRMDTYDGQSSLATNDSSQLNNMTSSSLSESIVSLQRNTLSSQVSDLMQIQVIYGTPSRVVKREIIRAKRCRIFHGKVPNKRIQQVIDDKDIDAVQIELPSVEDLDFSEESKNTIRKVLGVMELGFVIIYRDDDIYLVRRCKPHVYLSDGVSNSHLLPRSKLLGDDKDIKAFDFNGSFTHSVKNHKEKGESINKHYFVLTLGSTILENDPSPTRHVPVCIVVDHVAAARMRIQELGPVASDPVCSLSDSFDTRIHVSKLP